MNLNTKTSRDVPNIDRIASFPVASTRHSSHMDVVHPTETTTRNEEAKLMEKRIWKEQHAKDQYTKNQTPENLSEETESLNFSFGMKNNSMNITPTPISCVMQDTNQDKDVEKSGHDQQQRSEQTWQNQQSKGKEVQIGQSMNKTIMQNFDANTEAHLHNVVNEQIIAKKNTGRLKKRSKTGIRSNPTPRLCGDLFHLRTKAQRKATNKKLQKPQDMNNAEEDKSNRTAGQKSLPIQGPNKGPSIINSQNTISM
ncbi:hypothetical protein R3W88_033068 [Solanum pinnatisectum]|uniref:Uncharacterized protein n=1 Tax=Solanum pinnatisectum TaxID=50273 RepID=A0AAV9K2I4_9SOLN|nr:hypothetical protein R3W88_033068 [Solanum pinnatisectum]